MSLADELEGLFLRFLKEHLDPIGSGGLLVGLSGGSDSTALLAICAATADRHGRSIVAGHVNHGIRADAAAEEARLRELCSTIHVPFVIERIRFDRPEPSEAEMRRRRLRALRRIAHAKVCAHILLGHQRDDSVETVVLNLARGAGLRGLAGIPPVRGPFAHPLIEVPRASLRRYLEERGIPWIEDPTNLDPAHVRNRIRRIVLPLLETEVHHGASRAIARASSHLRRALEAIEEAARHTLDRCALPSPDGEIRLDGDRLRSNHPGMIDFTLRLAVRSVCGTTEDLSTPAWRTIVAAVVERSSGRFPILEGAVVETTARFIRIAAEIQAPPKAESLPVPWVGRTGWGRGALETRLAAMIEGGRRLRVRGLTRIQVFDAAALAPPVRIRLPRAGDKIALEEITGRRHLSDLLSERGIARSRRMGQPVLEDGRGILWAPGIRRAGVARVGADTKRIWIVRWIGPLPADHGLHGGSSRS